MKWLLALLFLSTAAIAAPAAGIDALARDYLRLTLAMAAHDKDYVDAYYGPPEIQADVLKRKQSLEDIKAQALAMQSALDKLAVPPAGSIEAMRLRYLKKQTVAMLGRIDLVQGRKRSFDEESALMYDAVAPHHGRAHFEAIIAQIDALLPGEGSTVERVNAFRSKFVIPRDKLRPVFDAAIQGCREQTLKHITLPEGENFQLEFVTGKPWSGYNWYKGKYQSLIQVNVELPIYIERAIDLGCHEGYPGHHVYNVLLEKNLVNERKWPEFSVYPLFSPQSLIAEGSANYGVELAFPEAKRKAFQRDVLYPLAGIDPALMEQYDALLKLTSQLSYAGNEAARDYLDGKITRQQAIDWLVNVELYPKEKAPQRTTFYDTYRSYIINYTVGKDLVKSYVETSSSNEMRWRAFAQLLSSPRLPSDLRSPDVVAAIQMPSADLPSGYWSPGQRRAVLDTVRTLRLDPDLSALRPGERAALKHLLEAGEIVQALYEQQLHPQAAEALAKIRGLPAGPAREELLQLFRLSKGPIATTLDNKREPFVPVSPVQRSKGVYPAGLARAELDAWLDANPGRRAEIIAPLSVVRRAEPAQIAVDLATLDRHPALDLLHPGLRARLTTLREKPGGFYGLPYSLAWPEQTVAVYRHLQMAADAVEADDADFAGYLRARARDLLSDDYEAGDAAWVTGRFGHLNAQIGAYETYDDELLGVRAFYSLTILVRRKAESDAVSSALGDLQAIHDALPIKFERKVRSEIPVGVFDVIADFGQSRGGNTATILPNDADHSRRYGRVIMMRDNIIRHPESSGQAAGIWRAAIVPGQQGDFDPEGSVQRTLWHEIGHYLGVDRTRDGRDIDAALQDSADLFEELKADLVSLKAVPQLQASGYYDAAKARAVYAAGILRVLQRNQPRRDQPYNTMQLMQWNWFLAKGVLAFDPTARRMRIDYARYPGAVNALLGEVLALQAAGDRVRAEAFVTQWTTWDPALHEVVAKAIRNSLQYRYSLYRYSALDE